MLMNIMHQPRADRRAAARRPFKASSPHEDLQMAELVSSYQAERAELERIKTHL